MKRTIVTLAFLSSSTIAFAQSAWVANQSQKVRPGDPPGAAKQAPLEAARNEFEAFHLVLDGGKSGLAAATVTASPLTGPSGATIANGDVRVYREGFYNVSTPSSVVGATGAWPDVMIPAVDEIANEARNAFPVDVGAGQQQPIYVEYHVPQNAAPGVYQGTVHVQATGFAADVPVTLAVHGFQLPSTGSLRTSFGLGPEDACIAHFGSYAACGGDAGLVKLNLLYARFALDHRISLDTTIYTGPQQVNGAYDWASWDASYAALLDGTAPTRLAGAHLTSVRYTWNSSDSSYYKEWASHFRQKGWFDYTFDYTCDEPGQGACNWGDVVSRAGIVHAGDPGFRTLVTTTLQEAQQNGVDGMVDILVPIINAMAPIMAQVARPSYTSWLGGNPNRQLWSYQSCQSDGCNIVGQETGWPSYMIDAPALYNRAMEWQSWRNKVAGELYYSTTYAFGRGDAWTNQYYYGGNGDGTLFYPGTPAKIGGKTDVPLASLRMKMIREGQEDYEYLKALAAAGDPTMADAEAAKLAPSSTSFTSDPAALDAARHRIAARIDQLLGYSIPGMPTATPSDNPDGGATAGVGGGPTTAGGAAGGSTSASNGASDPASPAAPTATGCSMTATHASRPGIIGLLASLALGLFIALRRRVRR